MIDAQCLSRAETLPDRLADLAVAALIAEAELTPKPGLVDARGSGAHADIDLDTLRASAHALRPTFEAIARASIGQRPSQALREQLAMIGRAGEAAMLRATGGSNTHRGAIWALGLLTSAITMEGCSASPQRVCRSAGELARHTDRYAPRSANNGLHACRRYDVRGARGEAEDGFPHVLMALDALRAGRRAGATEATARIDALIAVMATLDDTCVLHRGGRLALRMTRLSARAVRTAGGVGTPAGHETLLALDRRLLAINVSPGGSADMLAGALFLDSALGGEA